MPFTTTGRNKLLDAGKTSITHIGAFTDLGATEVAGGSYARQAITWTAAASGVTDNNAQVSIPIPIGTTVQSLGFFDAVSAGNSLGYWPIGSSGQILKGVAAITDTTNNILTSNGHGMSNDDRVLVWQVAGESFPTSTPSLSATTLYFAASVTADSFKLSTSAGGGAIVDLTGLGEITWAKTVPNTWASAGNLVIATGSLDLDLTFA